MPAASRDQDDARRLLQYEYDARARREPLGPRYRECPRAPPSALVCSEETCAACGPAGTRDCSLGPNRTGTTERGRCRAKRTGDLLHGSRAPPVALPVLASRSKTPRAARERRGPASSPPREREQFHADRGAFRRQDAATCAGIAPVRPLRVASPSGLPTPPERGQQGREGRCSVGPGPRLHLGRVEEVVRAGQLDDWDDVRPTARRPERP